MPLTDTAIRAAKPQNKTIRMFDGGGLYLELAPSGGKWWRLKYRVEGKEKRISLGTYPTIGLKEARLRRDEAKRLLAKASTPASSGRPPRPVSGAERSIPLKPSAANGSPSMCASLHGERNHVRAGHKHAEFLPERRHMLQEWADFLEDLRGKISIERREYRLHPSRR